MCEISSDQVLTSILMSCVLFAIDVRRQRLKRATSLAQRFMYQQQRFYGSGFLSSLYCPYKCECFLHWQHTNVVSLDQESQYLSVSSVKVIQTHLVTLEKIHSLNDTSTLMAPRTGLNFSREIFLATL